jgi:hypothetical protein
MLDNIGRKRTGTSGTFGRWKTTTSARWKPRGRSSSARSQNRKAEPHDHARTASPACGDRWSPTSSVHLTVTSIPFEELFTYSGKAGIEDVGNNGSTIDVARRPVRAQPAVRDRAAAPRDGAGLQRLRPHPAAAGLQEPARLHGPPRLPRGGDRRLHGRRLPLRRRVRGDPQGPAGDGAAAEPAQPAVQDRQPPQRGATSPRPSTITC